MRFALTCLLLIGGTLAQEVPNVDDVYVSGGTGPTRAGESTTVRVEFAFRWYEGAVLRAAGSVSQAIPPDGATRIELTEGKATTEEIRERVALGSWALQGFDAPGWIEVPGRPSVRHQADGSAHTYVEFGTEGLPVEIRRLIAVAPGAVARSRVVLSGMRVEE